MAPVGFKEYNDNDRYAARRAVNKTTNLIWKIVVVGLVILGLFYLINFLAPWQKQIDSTLNGQEKYNPANKL